MKNIRVVLTPAELPALRQSDLRATVCVVFDVLRATSTFVTALENGAQRIIPVSEIAEALAWHQRLPAALLAGERHGVKIGGSLTGGIAFDLGNSPREFAPQIVRDRTIVSTTTNGTRALDACRSALAVLAGSFLNLAATARFLGEHPAPNIVMVCAGTGQNAALEDVLAAGALIERLLVPANAFALADSAAIAWRAWREAKPDIGEVLRNTENGRRVIGIPELGADVAYCAQIDVCPLVAVLREEGLIGLHS